MSLVHAVLGFASSQLFGFRRWHEKIGNLFPANSPVAHWCFSACYLYRQTIGQVHWHVRAFGETRRSRRAPSPRMITRIRKPNKYPPAINPAVAGFRSNCDQSLFALLTFLTVESFVPFYERLRNSANGDGFAAHREFFQSRAVAGMVVFTWLTLVGMRRTNLRLLENHELGLMGVFGFCAVAS